MVLIGEYVLDTLQIYFPWDDDLYTYMKDGGLGSSGPKKKALPLIYTDNCESTEGKKETRRKYVLSPTYFGKTHSDLGWTDTGNKGEPIIPAEKIRVRITLENSKTDLKFKILPKDKQYHLEYSVMSSFGKMYSNWVALYFSIKNDNFIEMYNKMMTKLKYKENMSLDIKILKESKSDKREEFDYIALPLNYYEFSLEEFNYARDYVRLNGFKGNIPKLFFDSSNNKCKSVMKPIIKLGIVHTKSDDGFREREPQIAIKISQYFDTKSKRGKKAKVKGLISAEKGENYFLVKADLFMKSANKIIELLGL